MGDESELDELSTDILRLLRDAGEEGLERTQIDKLLVALGEMRAKAAALELWLRGEVRLVIDKDGDVSIELRSGIGD